MSEYNSKIKNMMISYEQEIPDKPITLNKTSLPNVEWLNTVAQQLNNLAFVLKTDGSKTNDLRKLRIILLAEEMAEYLEAEAKDDLVEIADALGDIKVILQGTGLAYGIPMDEIDDEIYASNMSKVGPDGKVLKRADGKTLKPEGFFRPNIEGFISDAYW